MVIGSSDCWNPCCQRENFFRSVATALNLHRKTATSGQDTPEGRARDKEVHNRERTWLMCYILDRSMSAQMGKPHSIKEEYVSVVKVWTETLTDMSVVS